MKTAVVILGVLVSFALSAQTAPTGVSQPLSEVRDDIKFLPLSLDEKLKVIGHAKILLSKIYVNLEHKKKLYNIDPLAALNRIERNAADLNEEQFHDAMATLFKSVNDLHANYYLPKPYSCYSTTLALNFDKNGFGNIFVSSIDLDKASVIKDLAKVELGDELINYNNLPVREALKVRQKNISASTPDAVFYQGVLDLAWQGMYSNLLPEQDVIQVTLKKANGSLYELSIPWFVSATAKCLTPVVEAPKESSGNRGDLFTDNIKERNNYWKKINKKFLKQLIKKTKLTSKIVNYEEEKVNLSNLQATDNDSLSWKTLKYKNRNFGYLKLTTFDAKQGLDLAVNQIRAVLENNLQDTSALVVDLRGNYGGMIYLAEEFAALLTPMPVYSLPFYVRANDVTKLMFQGDASWEKIIVPYADTNKIIGPEAITPKDILRKVSQAYFAKVVLLTNSECFSSCDLFSATMKDNAKAAIYGTDRSTYGGGANVWNFNELKDLFSKLGVDTSLPQGISMRITVRHAYRSNNTIIDDHGVPSDIIIQESTQEVLDKENSTAVTRILNDLLKGSELRKSSDIKLTFKDTQLTRHSNEVLNIGNEVKNIDQVALMKNGKILKRYHADGDNQLPITLDEAVADYGMTTYEVFGFQNNSPPKLPVLRKSFTVDNVGAFKSILNYDAIEDAFISNNVEKENCGWKKRDRSFVIDANYCLMLNMGITHSLIMDDKPRKLSFNLKLDAEPDYDSLEISVVSNGVVETIMKPLSTPTDAHFEYDLSKFQGQKIDIKFRFNSDEMFAGKGVELSEIEIN